MPYERTDCKKCFGWVQYFVAIALSQTKANSEPRAAFKTIVSRLWRTQNAATGPRCRVDPRWYRVLSIHARRSATGDHRFSL